MKIKLKPHIHAIKKNNKMQFLLRIINYYCTIAIIQDFIIGFIFDEYSSVPTMLKKIKIVFPNDFVIFLLLFIFITNIFLLNLSKKLFIKISFIINTSITYTGIVVVFIFFLIDLSNKKNIRFSNIYIYPETIAAIILMSLTYFFYKIYKKNKKIE